MIRRVFLLGLLAAVLSCQATPQGFLTIAGWSPHGEPATYDAAGLWELINGGADIFLSFGFETRRCRLRGLARPLASDHLPLGVHQFLELFGCDETLFDQDFTEVGAIVPAPLLVRCLGELIHRNHSIVNREAAEERAALIGHCEWVSVGRRRH